MLHKLVKETSSSLRPQFVHGQFAADLLKLTRLYKATNRPIEVNFRQLVPMNSGIDRATHLMHSYPAKLLPNIPVFFLYSGALSRSDRSVLDPFCGTGTVLLESALAGYRSVGADTNPLARMIAQAKVTHISRTALLDSHRRVMMRIGNSSPARFSPVVNVNQWFGRSTQTALARLLGAIRDTRDPDRRRFFEVCFSSCVRRLSRADPRMSVPVRMNGPLPSPSGGTAERTVLLLYERTVHVNIHRLEQLAGVSDLATKVFDDARKLPQYMAAKHFEPLDLIITSPPYLGAQKYIRASSLSIGWLGLAPENKLRTLERLNIGREHYSKAEYKFPGTIVVPEARAIIEAVRSEDPLRAHIASNYLVEMHDALIASCNVLRKGGHMILVAGDNSIRGRAFRTTDYLRHIVQRIGLRLKLHLLDDIRSRGLMTKRNRTAGIISREHIFVFKK
jgi:SAM-dependent methyltransferase